MARIILLLFLSLTPLICVADSETEAVCSAILHLNEKYVFAPQSLLDRGLIGFRNQAKEYLFAMRQEPGEERSARSQVWLNSFHGLKLRLANLQSLLPFNVHLFLNNLMQLHDKKPQLFAVLSDWLKISDPSQQLALFSNLAEIVTFYDENSRMQPGTVKTIEAFDILVIALNHKLNDISLHNAVVEVRTQLTNEANQRFIKQCPSLITEALSLWKNKEIGLTPQGTIPYEDSGIPHRKTYELGKNLAGVSKLLLQFLSFEDQEIIEKLIQAKKLTLLQALSDPHYRQLFEFKYRELIENHPTTDFDKNTPIWKFIDPHVRFGIIASRFREGSVWWRYFGHFNPEFKKSSDGSQITAQQSRSPLLRMYGPEAQRSIYWPTRHSNAFLEEVKAYSASVHSPLPQSDSIPDLSRLRVVENTVHGEVKSVEVLANREAGQPPVGFFFVNIAGDLVPSKIFDDRPVAQSCVRCHSTEAGSGVMSFRPFFLKTPQDFEEVGYKNHAVIKQLMAF